jgi:tetratricopeptide (TPR) repeat protein
MSWRATHRHELFAALAAGLLSFGIYAWTAAPNVTLLDSGEFLVAAQHFGVPHPTGYPLWTILGWAFQLLPLGNAAWELALFSGVCGALAVALCAGMLTNLLRWFLGERLVGRLRWLPPIVGFGYAMLFALSTSMWSQATIAEVYTLHALLVAAYLTLLYGWVRNPSHDRLLLWAFFVLALSFSNHHLTLTLAPLPLLLVLLLRRRALPDWILAGSVTLVLGYLCFAILSEELAVLKSAIRLFYVVAAGGIVFVWMRRGRVRWKLVAVLPLAVGAGLLPYAYMPWASSTNPPMNWAYTREAKGFYYSINRSQYGGALSDQSLRVFGRLLGTKPLTQPEPKVESPAGEPGRLQAAQEWVGFFWQQLSLAFTPFAIVGYFASIFFILRAPLPQRTWIYLLHFGFVLGAFLQPVLDAATIDIAGWWLQMPYHTYTNLIFALLSGLGWGLLLAKLAERRGVYFWLVPATLALPLLTAPASEAASSQRGRWFGWMYGRDMLADLPPGSVMIGGTDPGRFVPTYMIFGESPQDARHKREPGFDRRDLYIITQNALGEEFYMKYLRDQYTEERPPVANAFEKWLGRETIYPSKPLKLPTQEQVTEAMEQALEPDPETGKPLESDTALLPFSATLRWIWENNKAGHPFFVEESFPLRWTYDYAEPHGLVYRLHGEKIEKLSDEAIARDFAFWEAYSQRLLGDPEFRQDLDAQRAFAKLRITGGNIYNHRGLTREAERAFRQAIELWPASLEGLLGLFEILWEEKRFDEAEQLLERAYAIDPNNRMIVHIAASNQARRDLTGQMEELESKAEAGDAPALAKLLGILATFEEKDEARELAGRVIEAQGTNEEALLVLANFTALENLAEEHWRVAELLAGLKPEDPQAQFLLAKARMVKGRTNEGLEAARRAVELGGRRMIEQFRADESFRAVFTNEILRRVPQSAPEPSPAASPATP